MNSLNTVSNKRIPTRVQIPFTVFFIPSVNSNSIIFIVQFPLLSPIKAQFHLLFGFRDDFMLSVTVIGIQEKVYKFEIVF